jgi:hypothetical protein
MRAEHETTPDAKFKSPWIHDPINYRQNSTVAASAIDENNAA